MATVKLKALVITILFLTGVAASVAVAKGPPPGKGPNKTSSVSTGATTTTDKHAAKKMWICHKTGSGKWVKMRINKKAWPAHQRHGDTALTAPGTTTGSTASTGTTTGKSKGAGSCAAAAGSTTTTGP
jgi:hypothetical protein